MGGIPSSQQACMKVKSKHGNDNNLYIPGAEIIGMKSIA